MTVVLPGLADAAENLHATLAYFRCHVSDPGFGDADDLTRVVPAGLHHLDSASSHRPGRLEIHGQVSQLMLDRLERPDRPPEGVAGQGRGPGDSDTWGRRALHHHG